MSRQSLYDETHEPWIEVRGMKVRASGAEARVLERANEVPKAAHCSSLELAGEAILTEFSQKFSEILMLFGAPPLVRWSARQNIRRICGDPDEKRVYSKGKKLCEMFMARLLGTEHEPIHLIGTFGRWIRARMTRPLRRKPTSSVISLAQSLFRAKAVLGHATDRMVYSSLREHHRKVTVSVPDDTTVNEIYAALEPVMDMMLVGLRPRFEVGLMDVVAKSTGSTQSGRGLGGKVGRLVRAFHGVRKLGKNAVAAWEDLLEHGEPLHLPLSETKEGLTADPRLQRWDLSGADYERPEAGCNLEEAVTGIGIKLDGAELLRGHPTAEYPSTSLKWNSFLLQEALDDIKSGESSRVKVTAVCESAAKVRTVTSGSAAGATVATVWQQMVFDEMRKFPCFPSLSRTVTALEVNQVLGDTRVEGFAGSSDFTASTDLLNPSLTNRILLKLTEGFVGAGVVLDDNADKQIFYPPMPVICYDRGNPLYYEGPDGVGYVRATIKDKEWDWFAVNGDVVPLRTESLSAWKRCGQLMGQATSFPLLCLVNLGCSIAALRRSGIPLSRAIRMVIINGDDRLALTNRRIEDDFWALATPIGLHRSPGKSHESTRYASINSQDYLFRGGVWKRIPTLRAGLLFGIKKLKHDKFHPTQVITALFESVPHECEEAAIRAFLRRFRREIRLECAGRNLFIPIAYGGMGQVPPQTWDFRITPYQLALAERLALAQPYGDPSFGPHWPAPRETPPVKCLWDQVVAPYDKGTLADEIATFQKRISYWKICNEVSWELRNSLCCGVVHGKKRCPVCRTPTRSCGQERVIPWGYWHSSCDCNVGDRLWQIPRDRWEPCPHTPKRYFHDWFWCQCHGFLRRAGPAVKKVFSLSAGQVRSFCRPTVQNVKTFEARPERKRAWKVKSWNGYLEPNESYYREKVLEVVAAEFKGGRVPLPAAVGDF